MEMAMYLVTAVLTEGRSAREVAAAHGVSKTWVYELLARYRADGEAGLVARSRRPRRSPTRVAHRFEDDIVRIRKALVEEGFDGGAETIRVHLTRQRRGPVPSTSTIWRAVRDPAPLKTMCSSRCDQPERRRSSLAAPRPATTLRARVSRPGMGSQMTRTPLARVVFS